MEEIIIKDVRNLFTLNKLNKKQKKTNDAAIKGIIILSR